ncbi:TPA: hypothetical protein I7730_15885 [Vibrio vulnificus]|uniref:Uncharacterized protein n=1 Tax=Vibrio vulnificus TaxID=672 RepID=A0A8H9N1V9_VIBVL|nr:hypothetical protein [Vibrio vulnificus]HAS8541263.1 hypothetical protein [Vibrio vulnificus]
MKKIFVINNQSHYFVVDASAISTETLQGCEIFESQSEFYSRLSTVLGISLEEIEGTEFKVNTMTNTPYFINESGEKFELPESTTLEAYLSSFSC